MQHCTKVPLLLHNIGRYTLDPAEQQMLTESLRTLESSLGNQPPRIATRRRLLLVMRTENTDSPVNRYFIH